jgi:hypothetical protein
MSETKGKIKGQWGGKRTAGEGKKIGKPADIGSNGKQYADYLDDETIEILKKVNPNRSEAIRILAKQFKENSL